MPKELEFSEEEVARRMSNAITVTCAQIPLCRATDDLAMRVMHSDIGMRHSRKEGPVTVIR